MKVRLIIIALWLTALGGLLALAAFNQYGLDDATDLLIRVVQKPEWALPAILGFFLARPLLMVPTSILGLLTGVAFGIWPGVLVAVVGELIAGNLAYQIGRAMSTVDATVQHAGAPAAMGRLARWAQLLRQNALLGVFLMRSLYIPDDPVNYACGAMRVPRLWFSIGTFFGMMAPQGIFVSVGAAINLDAEGNESLLQPEQIKIAIGIACVSLTLAIAAFGVQRYWQRRVAVTDDTAPLS